MFVVAVVGAASAVTLAVYEAYDKYYVHPAQEVELTHLKEENAKVISERDQLKKKIAKFQVNIKDDLGAIRHLVNDEQAPSPDNEVLANPRSRRGKTKLSRAIEERINAAVDKVKGLDERE